VSQSANFQPLSIAARCGAALIATGRNDSSRVIKVFSIAIVCVRLVLMHCLRISLISMALRFGLITKPTFLCLPYPVCGGSSLLPNQCSVPWTFLLYGTAIDLLHPDPVGLQRLPQKRDASLQ
jgi:hypothetical protein